MLDEDIEQGPILSLQILTALRRKYDRCRGHVYVLIRPFTECITLAGYQSITYLAYRDISRLY
jgi:hypothetical protein